MMKITTDRPEWDRVCLVCTKSTEGGGGFACMKIEGAEIYLCCPGCLARFDADRERWLSRREILGPNEVEPMI